MFTQQSKPSVANMSLAPIHRLPPPSPFICQTSRGRISPLRLKPAYQLRTQVNQLDDSLLYSGALFTFSLHLLRYCFFLILPSSAISPWLTVSLRSRSSTQEVRSTAAPYRPAVAWQACQRLTDLPDPTETSPPQDDGGAAADGDDFLARERAALGDDADQFASPNDASKAARVDDDDLLGGDEYQAQISPAQEDTMQFESSFPVIESQNEVRTSRCT